MITKKNDDRNLLPTGAIDRSVAHLKRWLMAIVRICHEKKAGERLAKTRIENFFPIQQEVHRWSDRRKIVDRVLLSMMIFVHIDSQEQEEVLTLPSTSCYMILRGESILAVIPDQQMLRFKFMLNYSGETISMSASPLVPGEKIRVIKGLLAGSEGELVHVSGKSEAAVRLAMLGCTCVNMPAGCVEPVSEDGDLRDRVISLFYRGMGILLQKCNENPQGSRQSI